MKTPDEICLAATGLTCETLRTMRHGKQKTRLVRRSVVALDKHGFSQRRIRVLVGVSHTTFKGIIHKSTYNRKFEYTDVVLPAAVIEKMNERRDAALRAMDSDDEAMFARIRETGMYA